MFTEVHMAIGFIFALPVLTSTEGVQLRMHKAQGAPGSPAATDDPATSYRSRIRYLWLDEILTLLRALRTLCGGG